MVRNIFRRHSDLDDPIAEVLRNMTNTGPDSEEYDKLLTQLERLKKMRLEDNPLPSGDTWAIVAGNLVGILTIVGYEHGHVVVSKAIGMLQRSKHNQ